MLWVLKQGFNFPFTHYQCNYGKIILQFDIIQHGIGVLKVHCMSNEGKLRGLRRLHSQSRHEGQENKA